MFYYLTNISNYNVSCDVPESFIKNKYSIYEYELIKKLLNMYDINSFKVTYDNNGKPYLDNSLYISISHDEDMLAVCISKVKVGIDIQYFHKVDDKVKSFLKTNKKTDKDVIREFSSKEAIIKLEGLTLKDLNNINEQNYDIKSIFYKDFVLTIAK